MQTLLLYLAREREGETVQIFESHYTCEHHTLQGDAIVDMKPWWALVHVHGPGISVAVGIIVLANVRISVGEC